MTEQITLSIPTGLLDRARLVAGRAGLPVGDVLVEAITRSLDPLARGLEANAPAALSDEEVLAATDLQMPAIEDDRLSALLDRQQAGPLVESERAELTALMELYQRLLLNKAEALAEAVRRGLREPVQP